MTTEKLFRECGKWELVTVNNGGKEPRYSLDNDDDIGQAEGLIYAFIVNGKIRYIGEAAQTFNGRMGRYRNPGEKKNDKETTNQRVNDEIKKILQGKVKDENEVKIAFFDHQNYDKNRSSISNTHIRDAIAHILKITPNIAGQRGITNKYLLKAIKQILISYYKLVHKNSCWNKR